MLLLCISTALTAGASTITPRRLAHTTRTGARYSSTPSRASAPRNPWRLQLGKGPAERSWSHRNLALIWMLTPRTHSTSMHVHMPKRAAARAHEATHDARVRATPMAAATERAATKRGNPIVHRCSCPAKPCHVARRLTFCQRAEARECMLRTRATACRFGARMCIWMASRAPAASAAAAATSGAPAWGDRTNPAHPGPGGTNTTSMTQPASVQNHKCRFMILGGSDVSGQMGGKVKRNYHTPHR